MTVRELIQKAKFLRLPRYCPKYTQNASSDERKADGEMFKMTVFFINPDVIPKCELFY